MSATGICRGCITRKDPKYHEKRTLGSHIQVAGLLKTIDQAVQNKKPASAIINILGRAANLKNEKGYETAVSELLFDVEREAYGL